MRRLLLFASACVLVFGCKKAVFEERIECPATLVFKAIPAIENPSRAWVFFAMRVDGELKNTVNVNGTAVNSGLVFSCERGEELSFSAVYGWPDESEWNKGGLLAIPKGAMCPNAAGVYEVMQFPDTKQELEPVSLSFADLSFTVNLSLPEYNGGYDVMLNGDVDGYLFPSLELHAGEYECSVFSEKGGNLELRIPRITEGNQMILNVVRGSQKYRCDIISKMQRDGIDLNSKTTGVCRISFPSDFQ